VATSVVARKLTTGTESDRILDQLERVTGLHGQHVEGGRRYNLSETKDLVIAMASLKAQLDEISATWPIHLTIGVTD
jgi:hypothetical protein